MHPIGDNTSGADRDEADLREADLREADLREADPGAAIARLERRIEQLDGVIENCRKFMVAARVAIALGGLGLAALIVRAIPFEPIILVAGIAAVLCGIVLLGSNRSTADEARTERAGAEAERAALIGALRLRVVGGTDTLH